MGILEQIAEMLELAAVQNAVISFVNEQNKVLKDMFASVGVQVDINVEVKVESVDLQTFNAKFKAPKGGDDL